MVESLWAINASWSVTSGTRSRRPSGKLCRNASFFFNVGPFAGHPTSYTSILIRGQFQFIPSFLNSYLRFSLSASHFKSVYTLSTIYSIPPLVATHLKQPPSRSHNVAAVLPRKPFAFRRPLTAMPTEDPQHLHWLKMHKRMCLLSFECNLTSVNRKNSANLLVALYDVIIF